MSKILVVEDNEEIRDLIVRQLTRKGHDVASADDGATGVAAARQQRPEIVVMDMNLPVLDGWQAIKKLKDDPTTKAIPIIALTAHTTSGDRDAGYAAGADAFMTKPIDFALLSQRIDELLKKK